MLKAMFGCVLSPLIVCLLAQTVAGLSEADYSVAPPYHLLGIRAEVYILPILPYEMGDLEPYIDRDTVVAHYEGHHDAYRRKMNVALNDWRESEPLNTLTTQPLVKIMRELHTVPNEFKTKLRNNMGGFVNHALYWSVMSANPNGTERFPTGALLDEIESTFGSYFEFKVKFSTKAIDLFGSGYVWLVRDSAEPAGSQLSILTTQNQDCPISMGLDPLLVIDVWEHAYYLKHQFRRVEYITQWWLVVDWDSVEKLDQYWKKVAVVNFERDEL
jgi:Fe-Mn family superoxide dismutase